MWVVDVVFFVFCIYIIDEYVEYVVVKIYVYCGVFIFCNCCKCFNID